MKLRLTLAVAAILLASAAMADEGMWLLNNPPVRQIKEKAIRRMKHTSRSGVLKAYLG